ncbi:ATP-binding protein [Salinadaptatus halalkaliphilus]|uniref:ATP-binding protein n=1 Tax=Salinadaptatus halalkaliphilus TaxID=2419781 RepID=UPI002482B2D5|nr:ATP-binding protein [Salinadaptatus halalkaliphilus]
MKSTKCYTRALIENAMTHSSDPTPTVSVTAESGNVVLPPEPTKKAVVNVHIEDSNSVITDLDRTRLLGDEESPVHHGSGLGLWVANWVVTMSGGFISHTERNPQGNRVTITLLRSTA